MKMPMGENAGMLSFDENSPSWQPRLLDAVWSLAFVLLYLLLEWASYITPLRQLNLTPWNPAPALGLLYIIRRGRHGALMLLVAVITSDLFLRGTPASLLVSLWLDVVLTAGYVAMAWLLRRQFPDSGLFADRRGLMIWTAIVVIGSFVNSLLYISQLLYTHLLIFEEWFEAMMRFWIGDSVGIFVTMPVFWWLQDASRRALFLRALLRSETLLYTVFIGLSLWMVFAPSDETHFRYFYILFLPAVWAASRQGMTGAIYCVTLLQIGLLAGGLLRETSDVSLFELQIRAFLLALVGFLIGISVDEQRRAASDLRHSLRLAAAGEMAGALAHELNQPLTALAAYGSACRQLLAQGGDNAQLTSVVEKMTQEAARAAQVMRRLRDFFRTGATRLEYFTLQKLVDEVSPGFMEKACSAKVDFSVQPLPVARIHGDALQLGVVLRNLLANAFDAVQEFRPQNGQVGLSAHVEVPRRLVIEVHDNGPGPSKHILDQMFEPFASSKSSGLGLGLAISRTIVEAHGGSLNMVLGDHGCFRLILPME